MRNKLIFIGLITLIILLALNGCNKNVKQYRDGELKYIGTVNKDGVREGKGKWYQDGVLVYEGEYYNDYPNGQGKQYHPKTGIVIFKGEFKDGLFYKGMMYDEHGKKLEYYIAE